MACSCWALTALSLAAWLAPALLLVLQHLPPFKPHKPLAPASPAPSHTPHPLLQMLGVGYRAAVTGNNLTLNVGYSNPVQMTIPQGLTVSQQAVP